MATLLQLFSPGLLVEDQDGGPNDATWIETENITADFANGQFSTANYTVDSSTTNILYLNIPEIAVPGPVVGAQIQIRARSVGDAGALIAYFAQNESQEGVDSNQPLFDSGGTAFNPGPFVTYTAGTNQDLWGLENDWGDAGPFDGTYQVGVYMAYPGDVLTPTTHLDSVRVIVYYRGPSGLVNSIFSDLPTNSIRGAVRATGASQHQSLGVASNPVFQTDNVQRLNGLAGAMNNAVGFAKDGTTSVGVAAKTARQDELSPGLNLQFIDFIVDDSQRMTGDLVQARDGQWLDASGFVVPVVTSQRITGEIETAGGDVGVSNRRFTYPVGGNPVTNEVG